MRSLRSHTVRLILAGALSAMTWMAPTPADAAGTAVDMVEGSQNDANTWKFAPPDITVKAGTAVKWTNKGQQPHTASANDGSWDSGTMKNGATWEHVFGSPGEFPYVCAFHPQMTGVVRVTP